MGKSKPPPSEAELRQQRLAAALRDNLKKRKAQARARTDSAAESDDSAGKPGNRPAKR
ncbi:MAG: hypothetical protein K0S54_3338 [Alphaproteobacteria bacterium]|jgi:hypothetical protein|nr:hypothetical protein [Alphaproteobacteria bacterium]